MEKQHIIDLACNFCDLDLSLCGDHDIWGHFLILPKLPRREPNYYAVSLSILWNWTFYNLDINVCITSIQQNNLVGESFVMLSSIIGELNEGEKQLYNIFSQKPRIMNPEECGLIIYGQIWETTTRGLFLQYIDANIEHESMKKHSLKGIRFDNNLFQETDNIDLRLIDSDFNTLFSFPKNSIRGFLACITSESQFTVVSEQDSNPSYNSIYISAKFKKDQIREILIPPKFNILGKIRDNILKKVHTNYQLFEYSTKIIDFKDAFIRIPKVQTFIDKIITKNGMYFNIFMIISQLTGIDVTTAIFMLMVEVLRLDFSQYIYLV